MSERALSLAENDNAVRRAERFPSHAESMTVDASRTDTHGLIQYGLRSHPMLDVSDVYPENLFDRPVRIEVGPYAFPRDEAGKLWSRAFWHGLKYVDFRGKDVAEIGVGPGTNALGILRQNPHSLHISDYDRRMTYLFDRNVKHASDQQLLTTEQASRVVHHIGRRNLADWARQGEHRFDCIIGCLPQARLESGVNIHEGDAGSHVYDPSLYQSKYNDWHLGLNDAFLRQVSGNGSRVPLLKSNEDGTPGSVILNFAGRPGEDNILSIFRKNGFEPTILHREIIQVDPNPGPHTFASEEQYLADYGKHGFEFYADPQGMTKINARQALEQHSQGSAVYHSILVVQGILTSKHSS
ncbi:MAG TPA: hypothetical protein VJB82_02530 [Candidatus Peribacterales bacterium]|nr:hypothetical protein [Candidatus Peribacterales bacterium]